MSTDLKLSTTQALLQAYVDRTPGSGTCFENAAMSLPGGVTRSITYHAPYPLTLDRGEGSTVVDVDGNCYLDFQNNYTALAHGHNHPEIVRRLADAVGSGVVYNAPIELQRQLAEVITARIRSVDLVRFTNSGTEAVMNAVRLARAYTGRGRILKMEGAFHGSYDGVSLSVHPGDAPPAWPHSVPEMPGLAPRTPEGVLVAPYNDLELARKTIVENRQDLAGVIVEAVTWAPGGIPASPAFLTGLAEVCDEHDIVFILDEVVTSRLSTGGAQEVYGVVPDLTVFGKVIGGGLPIGALGGRRELMSRFDPRDEGYLPQSGTFSGSPLSMVAGMASLELLSHEVIVELNEKGDRLRARLSSVLEASGVHGDVTGMGSLGYLHLGRGPIRDYREAAAANKWAHRWLYLALLNRGVMVDSRGHFALSTAMGERELEGFGDALADALDEIRPLMTP
jgi:glutamate-1-semialdehyde 2,1-aminomutase